MPKTILIFLCIFIIATGMVWFGFEKIGAYWDIYSPLPKKWMIVHFVNGDEAYAKISGIGSFIRLSGVYKAEKFIKSESSTQGQARDFGMSGTAEADREKIILTKQNSPWIVNRSFVAYWEPLSAQSEIYKSLQLNEIK